MTAADKAIEKAWAKEQKRKAAQVELVNKMQRGEVLTASETVRYIEFFPERDRERMAYESMNRMHLTTAAAYVSSYK